jgi:hypothetical protein
MRHLDDPLLMRAAAVLASSRRVRVESRRLLDVCRIERLERELGEKLREIERLSHRPTPDRSR